MTSRPNDEQRGRLSTAIRKMRQEGSMNMYLGETADFRGLAVGMGAEDITVEVSKAQSNRGYFIVLGHTYKRDGRNDRMFIALNREQAGHLGYVLQELSRNAREGTELGNQGQEFVLEEGTTLVWKGDPSIKLTISTPAKVE